MNWVCACLLLLFGTFWRLKLCICFFNRYYRKTKLSGFQDMECIPCGDPPPPYEPHCKHLSFLLPLLTVGLTSVGYSVKCSHEDRLFIPARSRWCFKMKQQGYNSLKSKHHTIELLAKMLPEPKLRLQCHNKAHTHTHNMPAHGPWCNQNCRL